jgi:hypothetical protein
MARQSVHRARHFVPFHGKRHPLETSVSGGEGWGHIWRRVIAEPIGVIGISAPG